MAQGQNNNNQNGGGGGLGKLINQLVLFGLVFYFFFGNPFASKSNLQNSPSIPAAPIIDHDGNITIPDAPIKQSKVPTSSTGQHNPLVTSGFQFDLYAAISESDQPDQIELEHRNAKNDLQWYLPGIVFDDWSDSNFREKSITFDTPSVLHQNGTLYIHVWLVPKGANPNTIRKTPPSRKNIYMYSLQTLTKYFTHKVGSSRRNLLEKQEIVRDHEGEYDAVAHDISSESTQIQQNKPAQPESKITTTHWKGNHTISLITDVTVFPVGGIPPQIVHHFNFDSKGDYFPIVYQNDFWVLREDYQPLNDSMKTLKLDLKFEPLGLLKFSILESMGSSFSMQRDMFGAEEGEFEEVKKMLIDNPPWLLALTFAISLIHTVLDVLAFKNEIAFWKNRKSMKGLSLRTIYVNIVSNVIILLYLFDNDTNWLILVSATFATLIEFWKITRAAHVSIGKFRNTNIPWIVITEKQDYNKTTKHYDDEAMKYLYYALLPIVVGYAIYSLMYETHKSWYSWIVSSLAGCVYTFGFIMMTPQLFINYRLKSVAHLPWRAFVYKGINTFIDDLFAFIIRMPTMHRLRCLRDDIIFVIYLYQRWLYPVDPNRVEVMDGELGESATMEEVEQMKRAAEAPSNNKEEPQNSESTAELKVEGKENDKKVEEEKLPITDQSQATRQRIQTHD